jgi:hypothetical protein
MARDGESAKMNPEPAIEPDQHGVSRPTTEDVSSQPDGIGLEGIDQPLGPDRPSWFGRLKRLLIGKPRDLADKSLRSYVELGQRLGMPSASFFAVGTDAVDELEQLCLMIAKKFPKSTFFAGQLVFQKDTWLHRFLHNQTAYSLQRRLQWAGLPMVILPTRVR